MNWYTNERFYISIYGFERIYTKYNIQWSIIEIILPQYTSIFAFSYKKKMRKLISTTVGAEKINDWRKKEIREKKWV